LETQRTVLERRIASPGDPVIAGSRHLVHRLAEPRISG
jgi:hypothetical protein